MDCRCCGEHTDLRIVRRRLVTELKHIGTDGALRLDVGSLINGIDVIDVVVLFLLFLVLFLLAFRTGHLHHRRDSSSHGGRVDARERCQQPGYRRG